MIIPFFYKSTQNTCLFIKRERGMDEGMYEWNDTTTYSTLLQCRFYFITKTHEFRSVGHTDYTFSRLTLSRPWAAFETFIIVVTEQFEFVPTRVTVDLTGACCSFFF